MKMTSRICGDAIAATLIDLQKEITRKYVLHVKNFKQEGTL